MSSPTGTPVILYTTAGMPIGSFAAIPIYRITPASVTINGTAYNVSAAPAAGSIATGTTLLGNYLAEKATLNLKGKMVQRMDAIGTPSDKSLLRDDPTLTVTLQCAALGTPSLMPGDCMEVQIGMTAASTPTTPALIPVTRWFISADGINLDAGDPTKFQVTFELDRQNSSSSLVQF